MNRARASWNELMSGLAFLLTAAAGVLFLLAYLGRFRVETDLPYLDLAVGVLLLLCAVHFLRRLLAARRGKAHILTAGTQGPIWISPEAVRAFLLGILREEFGIRDARIALSSVSEGLGIEVQTSLPAGESIAELGERIQERIRSRVEERIGVSVERVEIFARGIDAGAHPGAAERRAEEGDRGE